MEDVAWRAKRLRIAEHFPGWTMDYIDSLSLQTVNDIFDYFEARQVVRDTLKKDKKSSGIRLR